MIQDKSDKVPSLQTLQTKCKKTLSTLINTSQVSSWDAGVQDGNTGKWPVVYLPLVQTSLLLLWLLGLSSHLHNLSVPHSLFITMYLIHVRRNAKHSHCINFIYSS